MKRILIVSQYFYPENFRINDLAKQLVLKGYHVDVLTSIPNYPEGVYYKGYNIYKRRKEVIDGINIYRAFQIPRGKKGTLLILSMTYLSFLFSSYFWILFKFVFLKKYDNIIAFQLSPITQVLPAILLKKLKGGKLITWVQDIWPDSITDNTSEKQNKILIPILSLLTEHVYKNSDKLLISSPGMKELVCRKFNYSNKIEYVPNWCDDFLANKTEHLVPMPKGFNLVMAGNIGEGIGIEDVINLVRELSEYKDINIIFIGGGSRKNYLKECFEKENLNNAYVLGRYPFEMMPSFYKMADAMLLTLMATQQKHLDVTIPSRLQSYLSAGKPVFAMIGSGAAQVIDQAKCGFVVPAGQYKELAKIIINNYKNISLLKEMGDNARNFYVKEFTLESGIKHFEELFENE